MWQNLLRNGGDETWISCEKLDRSESEITNDKTKNARDEKTFFPSIEPSNRLLISANSAGSFQVYATGYRNGNSRLDFDVRAGSSDTNVADLPIKFRLSRLEFERIGPLYAALILVNPPILIHRYRITVYYAFFSFLTSLLHHSQRCITWRISVGYRFVSLWMRIFGCNVQFGKFSGRNFVKFLLYNLVAIADV